MLFFVFQMVGLVTIQYFQKDNLRWMIGNFSFIQGFFFQWFHFIYSLSSVKIEPFENTVEVK